MEGILAVGASLLLVLFVGKGLLAPGKGGKTGQTKGGVPWADWLLPIAAAAGALAGLLPGIGQEGRSYGRFFAGVLLAGCFAAVGRMEEALEKQRGKGLHTGQRCLLFGTGGLACGAAAALWGEGMGSLALPFLGQVRLGPALLPVLALLCAAAGESLWALRDWDGLCLCFSWLSGAAVLCCAGILGLAAGQALGGALLGSALGFSLWQLTGARLPIGRQGTLLCAGLLAGACFACGLPTLLLPLLPLPLACRLAQALGGRELPLSLSERGVGARALAGLWALAALLCGGLGVAWVQSMYGR